MTSAFSSSCFINLNDEDKRNYLSKLTLCDGVVLPDPFSIKDDWSNDVSLLPDKTWPEMYIYLIEMPSEFTKDKLRAYKSLEAYNFFLNGHVLPSQRQGSKHILYEVWIAIHKVEGWIFTANCSCVAGLGSVCSHVAALLFKLQACCELQLNKIACTSKLCEWKKSRTNVEAAPLKCINFHQPVPKNTLPSFAKKIDLKLKGFTSNDPAKFSTEKRKELFQNLHILAPKAVVLKSVSWCSDEGRNCSDTDTADENELNSTPEPITALFEPSLINEGQDEIKKKSKVLLDIYIKSCYQSQFNNLENLTKTQSKNAAWKIHRAGRITASISKMAYNLDINNPSQAFINKIMQYSDNLCTTSTDYGLKMENVAKSELLNSLSQQHINLCITDSGLYIDADYPWLGASPDGIVKCDCHGMSILEIKCPYKFRNSLELWKDDKNCPLNKDGVMKANHQYYYQIQHQMMVTKIKYCLFYVWSNGKMKNDKLCITVKKDKKFVYRFKEKLKAVFEEVILPEIVTRKLDPKNKNPLQLFCLCKRPQFSPIIECNSLHCPVK
ncbi:uncharacterized protein LOC136075006 [Hydra vulgaris]|uniref:Uncharacterized protein LOC136075006 n=1 Tax=Hydra vulgaris TaxID=6087 RepID=A0ABM4B364_HYDVU